MGSRTVLDDFRRAIAAFDSVVDEVDRVGGWERPTPCTEWMARDVVTHLADWTPFLLLGVGRTPPDPALSPIERWRFVAAALESILAEPAEAATEIETGPPGRMPVSQAIAMFVTGDVVFHTWDLARSIDLRVELDAEILADQLAGMEPLEAEIRSSGHFGAPVEVSVGATVVDRALAFTGRDPAWRPST